MQREKYVLSDKGTAVKKKFVASSYGVDLDFDQFVTAMSPLISDSRLITRMASNRIVRTESLEGVQKSDYPVIEIPRAYLCYRMIEEKGGSTIPWIDIKYGFNSRFRMEGDRFYDEAMGLKIIAKLEMILNL